MVSTQIRVETRPQTDEESTPRGREEFRVTSENDQEIRTLQAQPPDLNGFSVDWETRHPHGVIVDDWACDCDGGNEATKQAGASGLTYNSRTSNKKEKRSSEGNGRERKKGQIKDYSRQVS